jgi:hypothetical protein
VLVEELEAFARRLPTQVDIDVTRVHVLRRDVASDVALVGVRGRLVGDAALRNHMSEQGLSPANFFFEKFANSGVVTAIGAVLSTSTSPAFMCSAAM